MGRQVNFIVRIKPVFHNKGNIVPILRLLSQCVKSENSTYSEKSRDRRVRIGIVKIKAGK